MQIRLENGQELKRGIWFKAIHFGGFLQPYIFPFIFKLGTSTYFYPIPHIYICCLAFSRGHRGAAKRSPWMFLHIRSRERNSHSYFMQLPVKLEGPSVKFSYRWIWPLLNTSRGLPLLFPNTCERDLHTQRDLHAESRLFTQDCPGFTTPGATPGFSTDNGTPRSTAPSPFPM